jgi:hypothetical protein
VVRPLGLYTSIECTVFFKFEDHRERERERERDIIITDVYSFLQTDGLTYSSLGCVALALAEGLAAGAVGALQRLQSFSC